MFWISVIFFLSGLSALVYQLLWMRHLGFIFGNTVYASATVLTAFMGGLGLGSHFFGRIGERLKNPVRCFAWLEWGIALYALALPLFFRLIHVIYVLAYRHVSESLYFLTPLRFVLAFIFLLFPTICMGGTLPVLIRGLAREEKTFGIKLGWLYGINTLGAVAGIFLCGFYLIPAVGLTNTNIIAVGTDLAAGAGAWVLARSRSVHQPAPEPPRPKFRWSAMPFVFRYAAVVAFACGFVSLALEVIWFRALIMVFGSTTYSFTVMLGVFLLGISLGSLIIAPFLDRIKNLFPLLAGMVTLVGVITFWSLYRFDYSPDFLLGYLLRHEFDWRAMNEARFLISVSHLMIPALLFGAIFTVATRMVRRDAHSSSGATGFVYAMDTFGAVLGSFAGGFILLPALGIQTSLFVLGVLMFGGGLLSLVVWGKAIWMRAGAGVLAVLTAAALLWNPPAWNPSVLAAGAFFSPFNFVRDGRVVFREVVIGDRLIFYEEALTSTISVHRGDDEKRFFCVDGKTEADELPRGMVVQRMIGHLPLLFHPEAKKAVNIGLGAGVSFGALSCHPLDHFEVIEIEPMAAEGARVWGGLNHHVVDNPNAIITINDGRNQLLCSTRTYDVITSDPFEPVVGGAAHLFTVNHFKTARNRLNPGGIMCQWIPMYEMSPEDYLTIVRSFVTVFPDAALFYTGFDTLILGFKDEMRLDAEVLRRNYNHPAVRESLEEVGFMSPEMILGMFVADLTQKPEFAAEGRINTDDRPFIEYSVPKSALRYTTDENQAALLHIFTPIPEAWLAGLDEETALRLEAEHEAVRLALEASVLRSQGRTTESFERLARGHEISPQNPVIKNEMVAMLSSSAQAMMNSGRLEDASRQFQMALQLDPADFWSLFHLVNLGMRANRPDFAGRILNQALEAYPESPLMIGLHGKFLFSMEQQEEGLALMKQAVEMHPNSLGLWNDLRSLASLHGDVPLAARAQENIDRIERFIGRRRR